MFTRFEVEKKTETSVPIFKYYYETGGGNKRLCKFGFVYMFLDNNGNVLYVGSTTDPVLRLHQHIKQVGKETSCFRNEKDFKIAKLISVAHAGNSRDARILEDIIIRKLRPKLNTTITGFAYLDFLEMMKRSEIVYVDCGIESQPWSTFTISEFLQDKTLPYSCI